MVASSNSVHGQTPGGFGGLAVVNDQVPPEAIGLPSVSVPATRRGVRRRTTPAARSGVKVTVRVVASYDVRAGDGGAVGVDQRQAAACPAPCGLENARLTVVVAGTLDEPGSGARGSAR